MDERLGEFKGFLRDYRGGNIRELKQQLKVVLPPLPEDVVIRTVHRVWNAHHQGNGWDAVMELINSARFAVATDVPHPHTNNKRFSRMYGAMCHLSSLGRMAPLPRPFYTESVIYTVRKIKDNRKLLWRQQRRQQRRH